jgi:hypothetical protein
MDREADATEKELDERCYAAGHTKSKRLCREELV